VQLDRSSRAQPRRRDFSAAQTRCPRSSLVRYAINEAR
jgi:hypothetical protein